MAEVLENVRRGIRRLAALGVKEIIVAADYGHVFVEDVDGSMKVGAPGGATVDLHPRVWVGRGGAAHERYLRVTAGRLGMAGDLELVFPRGLACLRSRGSGGGYFHGGISLQEVVVPVAAIRVSKPPAQGVETTRVTLTVAKPKITTRYYHDKDLDRFNEIGKARPELFRKFMDWYSSSLQPGALTKRENVLIGLGEAHAIQCPYCIDAYTKKALLKRAWTLSI